MGRRNTKLAGFTLVELMIAVAVVAILAAVAVPSYQNAIVKSRRGAAAACMGEAAQFMERFYTTNLSYLKPDGTAPTLPAAQCQADLADHYTIALAAGTTARTYVLTATPKSAQATKDTKCGTLKIDQRGTKSISGSGSVSSCF